MAETARSTRRIRNALVSAATAGLTLVATACEQQRPTSTGGVATRETLPSGIERVTNTLSANPTTAWTLVEELRVGSADGDGPDVFGELRGLVVLPDGGFAVLDSQAQEVRVFAADGAHRASYGGEGEGPGELRGAHGLMLDPAGRIWVTDPSNSRLSVFDPETGFVESFRHNFAFYAYTWQGTMTADGRIVRPTARRQGFEIYDLNMELVESISRPGPESAGISAREAARQGEDATPSSFAWQSRDGSRAGFMGVPYYPRGVRYYDREGTVWVGAHEDDPAGYRLTRQNLVGDTVFLVAARKPHTPVTPDERNAAIEQTRERLRQQGADTDRDWSKIPDVKPAIANLFTSVEGDIWVRTPSADSDGDEATWDLFSADGAFVGRVTSPELSPLSFLPPVVRGDEFWAVATDAFDVQYVVRARITPSG
jgi:hypothetical protein